MAFVRRNKNKFVFEESSIDKSSNFETLKKSQINSEELLNNFTHNKTYQDMTIEVLNILDSQGINIYDENRKPGMYQKGKRGIEEVNINNMINSLSKDNKKFEDFGEDLTNNNINSLLEFFNKK